MPNRHESVPREVMTGAGEKAECGLCRLLPWDSDFFGCRIAAVNGDRLTEEGVHAIDAWCRSHDVACLYFLARSDEPSTIRLAEQSGFHLVEVRLTFERFLADIHSRPTPRPLPGNTDIRPASRADIPALRRMAAEDYTTTRYNMDQRFSPERVRAYYQTWITNCIKGKADFVLVAEHNGDPAGYIAGSVCSDPTQGIIELANVDDGYRGGGISVELFQSAFEWYVRAGVKRVTGATQGANLAPQRLLQRLGFLPLSCGLYYHRWYTPLDL
jgi:dTDP-4-amino-4,6-dideoxy-D-galactose acyltransferase